MTSVRVRLIALFCSIVVTMGTMVVADVGGATGLEGRERGAVARWLCPMHLSEVSPTPGLCRICRMTLVSEAALALPAYEVGIATSPGEIVAGEPLTLRLTVRSPGGSDVVRRFDLVHEMWFHLFIVSDDLAVYQHLHPTPQADGSWTIETTLPSEGHYSVLSDFAPTGAAPQFLRNRLVTKGAPGRTDAMDPLVVSARTVTSGSLTATLEMPDRIATDRLTTMTYRLVDASSHTAVTDLQPYLGAFGHTLIVGERVTSWVHAHPTDMDAVVTPRSRGGPAIAFDAYFTEPGRYRAWTQFMRGGAIHTVSFTFDVTAPQSDR